jgi:hypothetical protein
LTLATGIEPVTTCEGCQSCAVVSTIASYALVWDARDEAAFTDLFLAGGVLEFDIPSAPVVLRAHREIAGFARERWATLGDRASRHVQGLSAVEFVAADVARARTPVIVTHTGADGVPRIHRSGVYHDELHRHDGRWRFASRRLTVDRSLTHGPAASAAERAEEAYR